MCLALEHLSRFVAVIMKPAAEIENCFRKIYGMRFALGNCPVASMNRDTIQPKNI
jgi:hypothetical protein